MTTSTNKTKAANDDGEGLVPMSKAKASLADGLTIIRVVLAPIIAGLIILAWHGEDGLRMDLIVLASVLFGLAAITDFLDDYVGGAAHADQRLLGWLDDIADSILVTLTLLALLWVARGSGVMFWTFALPAIVLIGRDFIVGLVKGFELSTNNTIQGRFADTKSLMAMVGVLILVACPWLTNVVLSMRAPPEGENLMSLYDNPMTWVWNIGLSFLWIAAIFGVISAYNVFTAKAAKPANDTE